eukprot:6127252-Prymnesium_polylepis.1
MALTSDACFRAFSSCIIARKASALAAEVVVPDDPEEPEPLDACLAASACAPLAASAAGMHFCVAFQGGYEALASSRAG